MLKRFGVSMAMAGTIIATVSGNTGAAAPVGKRMVPDLAAAYKTATPIKHVVVIYGENVSFDHYFATYPKAQNLAGETPFVGKAPINGVNNLLTPLDPSNGFAPITNIDLLNSNPNGPSGSGATGNGVNASNPFRLAPSQAATSDQGHNYNPEQHASDNGLMDLFPQYTGTAGPPPGSPSAASTKGLVMAYYDGNTVGTLWNYAQQYALNDNSFTSQYGPSTPGAINLISGQTNGIAASNKALSTFSASHMVADGAGGYTMIGDVDPLGDVCSTAAEQVTMAGKNIGDLLNAANITWGSFMGGFNLSTVNSNASTGCSRVTNPTVANYAYNSLDYIPHHAWFQYYASTANPTHARPSSTLAIGHSFVLESKAKTPEPANHNYDSQDFFSALSIGNLPAVTFLKAPAFQDAHAGYSDPVDEEAFVASVVNALKNTPMWDSTAVIIAYDDSDGWYDHQIAPVVNPSASTADALNGTGACTTAPNAQQGVTTPATPLLGTAGQPVQGRCGHGTRVPLMVISPYAKADYVDHTLTDQSSVLRFIEDNWLGGERIQQGGSFDTIAGSIDGMFDFTSGPKRR